MYVCLCMYIYVCIYIYIYIYIHSACLIQNPPRWLIQGANNNTSEQTPSESLITSDEEEVRVRTSYKLFRYLKDFTQVLAKI